MATIRNCNQRIKYPVFMCFILGTLLESICYRCVCGSLHDMFHNTSAVHLNLFLDKAQYHNITSSINQFITTKYTKEFVGTFYPSHYFYKKQCQANDLKQQTHLHTSGYYDTLTNDDIVRNQYSLLPYPPVTKEELERERMYYNGINLLT